MCVWGGGGVFSKAGRSVCWGGGGACLQQGWKIVCVCRGGCLQQGWKMCVLEGAGGGMSSARLEDVCVCV